MREPTTQSSKTTPLLHLFNQSRASGGTLKMGSGRTDRTDLLTEEARGDPCALSESEASMNESRGAMIETDLPRPPGGAPDPVGLAVAREMQERLRPVEVILLGSRAAGDHRQDSDVDLMAVCADEAGVRETDRMLRQLLEGKYEVPVVNVVTITRSEFIRTAPLGQSYAGQAVRHGVTPDGKSLNYRPEREPTREEIREATVFWLYLAETHLKSFDIIISSEDEQLRRSNIPAFQGQTALERAFKGLLAAGNDGTRFRRDAAVMWRHIQGYRPHHGPERRGGGGEPAGRHHRTGKERMQPDQVHGGLAARRNVVPDPTEDGAAGHDPAPGPGGWGAGHGGAGPVGSDPRGPPTQKGPSEREERIGRTKGREPLAHIER